MVQRTQEKGKQGDQTASAEAQDTQNALNTIATFARDALLTQRYYALLAVLALVFEAALTLLIIKKVPYTEIDFSTYMQQVDVFLKGQRDYTLISGDTGPCVYPAGHVYAYSLVHRLTDGGKDLQLAQYLFAALYLTSQALVFGLYYLAEAPALLLPLLVLSKRLHSTYVLRLFNDGLAVTLMWAAVLALCRRKTNLAVVLTSLALSIKMNILLFLPGLAVILFRTQPIAANIVSLLVFAAVQVLTSLPFVAQYPHEYVTSAFDLGRQFLYKWTVNWRFLSEETFLDRRVSIALLAVQASLLAAFGLFRWTGIGKQGPAWVQKQLYSVEKISPTEIIITLTTSNLIGILCARSLHYQFYSWYAQTIPLLVWSARLPLPVKLLIPPALEYAWNVFPSTSASSAALCLANAVLVLGLWQRGSSAA